MKPPAFGRGGRKWGNVQQRRKKKAVKLISNKREREKEGGKKRKSFEIERHDREKEREGKERIKWTDFTDQ